MPLLSLVLSFFLFRISDRCSITKLVSGQDCHFSSVQCFWHYDCSLLTRKVVRYLLHHHILLQTQVPTTCRRWLQNTDYYLCQWQSSRSRVPTHKFIPTRSPTGHFPLAGTLARCKLQGPLGQLEPLERITAASSTVTVCQRPSTAPSHAKANRVFPLLLRQTLPVCECLSGTPQPGSRYLTLVCHFCQTTTRPTRWPGTPVSSLQSPRRAPRRPSRPSQNPAHLKPHPCLSRSSLASTSRVNHSLSPSDARSDLPLSASRL